MAVRIVGFIWDDANQNHIARHRVEPDEAEEALASDPWLRRSGSGRYIAVGRTDAGRFLVVVFEMAGGGLARVVTARDADPAEKRLVRREQT